MDVLPTELGGDCRLHAHDW